MEDERVPLVDSTVEDTDAGESTEEGFLLCMFYRPNKSGDKNTYISITPFMSFLGDGYTVQNALDHIGFGKFHIKMSLLAGVAWVSFIYLYVRMND